MAVFRHRRPFGGSVHRGATSRTHRSEADLIVVSGRSPVGISGSVQPIAIRSGSSLASVGVTHSLSVGRTQRAVARLLVGLVQLLGAKPSARTHVGQVGSVALSTERTVTANGLVAASPQLLSVSTRTVAVAGEIGVSVGTAATPTRLSTGSIAPVATRLTAQTLVVRPMTLPLGLGIHGRPAPISAVRRPVGATYIGSFQIAPIVAQPPVATHVGQFGTASPTTTRTVSALGLVIASPKLPPQSVRSVTVTGSVGLSGGATPTPTRHLAVSVHTGTTDIATSLRRQVVSVHHRQGTRVETDWCRLDIFGADDSTGGGWSNPSNAEGLPDGSDATISGSVFGTSGTLEVRYPNIGPRDIIEAEVAVTLDFDDPVPLIGSSTLILRYRTSPTGPATTLQVFTTTTAGTFTYDLSGLAWYEIDGLQIEAEFVGQFLSIGDSAAIDAAVLTVCSKPLAVNRRWLRTGVFGESTVIASRHVSSIGRLGVTGVAPTPQPVEATPTLHVGAVGHPVASTVKSRIPSAHLGTTGSTGVPSVLRFTVQTLPVGTSGTAAPLVTRSQDLSGHLGLTGTANAFASIPVTGHLGIIGTANSTAEKTKVVTVTGHVGAIWTAAGIGRTFTTAPATHVGVTTTTPITTVKTKVVTAAAYLGVKGTAHRLFVPGHLGIHGTVLAKKVGTPVHTVHVGGKLVTVTVKQGTPVLDLPVSVISSIVLVAEKTKVIAPRGHVGVLPGFRLAGISNKLCITLEADTGLAIAVIEDTELAKAIGVDTTLCITEVVDSTYMIEVVPDTTLVPEYQADVDLRIWKDIDTEALTEPDEDVDLLLAKWAGTDLDSAISDTASLTLATGGDTDLLIDTSEEPCP